MQSFKNANKPFADYFAEYLVETPKEEKQEPKLFALIKTKGISVTLWSRLFNDFQMYEPIDNANFFMNAIHQGYFVAYACHRIKTLRDYLLNENGTFKKEILEKLTSKISAKSLKEHKPRLLQDFKNVFYPSEQTYEQSQSIAHELFLGVITQVSLEFGEACNKNFIPKNFVYLASGFFETIESGIDNKNNLFFLADLAQDAEKKFAIKSFKEIQKLSWDQIKLYAEDVVHIKEPIQQIQDYLEAFDTIKSTKLPPSFFVDIKFKECFMSIKEKVYKLSENPSYLAFEKEKKAIGANLKTSILELKQQLATSKADSQRARVDSGSRYLGNDNDSFQIKKLEQKVNQYEQLAKYIDEISQVKPIAQITYLNRPISPKLG